MPISRFLAALATTWLTATAAHAEHRVLLVVPPDSVEQAGDAIDVETRLGHSPDVSLISRAAQLEILRGLKKDPSAHVDDAVALQLAQLSGADGVVLCTPVAWRLCTASTGACAKVDGDAATAAAAVLSQLKAGAPEARTTPWPDDTKNAEARAAYAQCRTRVSVALEQEAVKGRKTQVKGLDADCKKALAADSAYAPAQAALAAARALQGDAGAEKALRRALLTLPTDPLPAEALIHLLVEKDRSTEALETLAVAETSAKNSIDLRRLRGERLFAMDMFAEALPSFWSALQLAPRSPYLHWRLSYTLHMKADNAEALRHAQAASELTGGQHPFYQEEYASRLIDNGKYAEAQAILETLRKADPSWGRVALRLGYALHMQGKSKDALPLLSEAIKAKPREHREEEDHGLAMIDLARVDAKLGDVEGAFAQLNKIKDDEKLDIFELKDADFDGIRADPRFASLSQ